MGARKVAATIAALVLLAPAVRADDPPTPRMASGTKGQGPGQQGSGEQAQTGKVQQQGQAPGQPAAPPMTEEERKKLEADIAKQLGGAAGAAPAPGGAAVPGPGAPPGAPGAAAQPQGQTGGSPYARLLLLPDISAIGDFSAPYDSYKVGLLSPRSGPFAPAGKFVPEFDEVELALQAVVDPYVRGDVFISFTPAGASVEEAYITTLSLPASLQVKAGQFFSPFGRINQQHPHIWDFVDQPLALNRVLAFDVLSGPGAYVAWLAPLPWFAEAYLDAQATAPYPGDVDRFTALARFLQYFQAGEATTIGVGFSGGAREEGAGTWRELAGADVYIRIRPPTTRAWLALQGEWYGRRFSGVPGSGLEGGYVQAFWRANAYFGYGLRFDDAPAVPAAGPGREYRVSGIASWFPSEFLKLRTQLAWDRRPFGHDGFEGILALEFAMGAHGAHPF